jgi:hypothetical protein
VCLFGGGDASERDHLLRCDGRQGALEAAAAAAWPAFEAPPAGRDTGGTTRSTAEAMDLLKRYRRRLIATGVVVACDLIAREGVTHSRAVLQEMERRGELDGPPIKDYWLGAIFNRRSIFCWTGDHYTYSDDSTTERGTRNIHERTIKVWTLRRSA